MTAIKTAAASATKPARKLAVPKKSETKATPAPKKTPAKPDAKPTTVRLFVDENRHSFLQVGERAGAKAFLTFGEKQVEVVYLSEEKSAKLANAAHSFTTMRDASHAFIKSKQPKSALAAQVLDAILDAKEDKLDYLADIIASNAEAQKKAGSIAEQAKGFNFAKKNVSGTKAKSKDKNASGETRKREVPNGYFALGEVLSKFNLDGKRTRAVLRVKMSEQHKSGEGWFFKTSERANVEAEICKLMGVK